mmetsp:Transcript_34941/g.43174  ORF Transcript_34941/g.43174 Transcript_34941/m.43174 type:complete len:478 (-) Transcript_34941:235-1668(-)|eukprot:CAMPEP_0204825068 /NCGR_PEP_ID=MMETSP1346-20131115/3029_1 /ASSEMBLY_ACC=CAM_ASM_000771 /TAXON_ID=215587 /ORGANISM="Aplanochytrium stocchinoi, Strain GSBS06" /LENGTH=477 /DNA_ID=CAMNT_0051952563 /DNA_START=273 /DNA_END=1706 /DNA_ORIENTATION=-
MLDVLKSKDGDVDMKDVKPSPFQKKIKEDFAAEAKKAIAEAKTLVQNGNTEKAVESLLIVEKRARLGGDVVSVENCALTILKIFAEKTKDFEKLNFYISLLCKRRGQSEGVQTKIIEYGASTVDGIAEDTDKESVIDTLRTISAGKMKVEVIRANLTRTLAKMKEDQNKLKEAATILQEETPETYATMEYRMKTEYLLEQVRLCLLVKDYIRANIIAKKVDRAKLEQLEDAKITFYGHLIEYYTHMKDPLELARAHLAIYKTPKIQKDEEAWSEQLKSCIIFLCASAYDNHQIDLVHNVLLDPNVKQIPAYQRMLKHFVTNELAQWPLPDHDEISKHSLLKEGETASKMKKGDRMEVDAEEVVWVYNMLRDRVIEHDIRVVSKYYTRIHTERLAEMLQLTENQTEEYVSNMVTATTSQRLTAKIDRPDGIISFEARKDPDENLTEWTDNISELLSLVEKTCHLIHKENMIYQIAEKK